MCDGYRPCYKEGIIIHLAVCVCDGVAAGLLSPCVPLWMTSKALPTYRGLFTLRNTGKMHREGKQMGKLDLKFDIVV